ncbi:MAG TPA: glutamine-hydrolyzing GMP synthase [Pseudobdellovibrionaceae bacterium]|nr:glutamine-hydrolyzing GMP synthase [Pseudobdellovibrionaceae bacterium]
MLQRGFIILDFGSQFTQLIARRLRELGHYSEVHPFNMPIADIRKKAPYGIILSGGPNSVYDPGAPSRDITELVKEFPILGICYGMQILAHALGGKVSKAEHREYGAQQITWRNSFPGLTFKTQNVWMSHGDVVEQVPPGFAVSAMSDNHIAAMKSTDEKMKVLAVQFHPEVVHTYKGEEILSAFTRMVGTIGEWNPPHILELLKKDILEKVGNDHVLCALSGGVDSTVVASLLTKILGKERVHCVFVNNGLLRKNEFENVTEQYKKLDLNVRAVDARKEFLTALSGLSDPEEKRKTIGRVFIEVFEKNLPEINAHGQCQWLAQGTLYPDVIESVSSIGGSVTIKSHHNVGGLPEKMKLKLLEPVRDLFKDEVRNLGRSLGLDESFVLRHPFPGPGLAIRLIGELTAEKLEVLSECDAVFIDFLKEKQLYHKIWQAFVVLLPVQTVGVQGDSRTYENVIALRAVTSQDGMTADWYPFSHDELREVSNRITNKVKAVNRVVYDVTSKPPATIEWE